MISKKLHEALKAVIVGMDLAREANDGTRGYQTYKDVQELVMQLQHIAHKLESISLKEHVKEEGREYPVKAKQYRTIKDIKAANVASGGVWFSRDTMRYWSSKIHSAVYGGRYFITSEQFRSSRGNGPRKWSIRVCNDDGSIDTVGESMAYNSLQEAEDVLSAFV